MKREDFPILQNDVIYFDNACMTLKPVQVIDKINEYYRDYPACGARSLHKLGKRVDEEIDNARKSIAKFIGGKSEEIVFTKNTTESLNLVANGFKFKAGDIVLSTDKEHNSNLIPWLKLQNIGCIKHKVVPSLEDNTFDLERFKEMVKGVKVVSMVHTSNLDGVSIPLKEIISIAHDAGAKVVVDAAQSIPHKKVDVKKLDADFIAFSGHKMLGPTGTGVLWGKRDELDEMHQFLVGGETVIDSTYDSYTPEKVPNKFEAGLQHYAGIIGLGEAAKYLMKLGMDTVQEQEFKLNNRITEGLKEFEVVKLIGPPDASLRSGIISFTVDGIDAHNVAGILDHSANIMCRSGAHCVHSWFNKHNLAGSIRASLYFYNTLEECDIFIDTMRNIVNLVK